MRAYVFTDPTLTRQAGRYVWLALDTEKAGNAALRKRLQVNALPSFFVLDPATEKVAIRWVGGMSVAQVQRMMDDGETRVAHRAGSAWQTALARADALYGEASHARWSRCCSRCRRPTVRRRARCWRARWRHAPATRHRPAT